jgi:hypothetical protein
VHFFLARKDSSDSRTVSRNSPVWSALSSCDLRVACDVGLRFGHLVHCCCAVFLGNKSIVISPSFFFLLHSLGETLFVKPGRMDGWAKVSRNFVWAIEGKNPSNGPEPSF